MTELNRRNFMRVAGAASAGTMLAGNLEALSVLQSASGKPAAANDNIQIALIGAGGQGMGDTKVAVQVPGVKLVAVADCYNGRIERSKELWGSDIQTTRDYAEILARPDIDAVIIGTPDHWHKQAAVDAMKAGKDVYCEKPMIHLYSDGPEMIETARSTKRILQVGSQRVSSVIYERARQLLASGAIGQLNMVTARWDRNSAMGAWDYTVPPDASTETCDWSRFLGTAPKIPFNAEHFFQWRKWKAYGHRRHPLLERWTRCRRRDARPVRLPGRLQPEPACELRGWRRRERRLPLHRFGRQHGDRRQLAHRHACVSIKGARLHGGHIPGSHAEGDHRRLPQEVSALRRHAGLA